MAIMMTLRDRQEKAIEMLRESLRQGHKRPLLQAPTGFGKTIVAAAITDFARSKGHRVTFTVPRIELIDQTVERFEANGLEGIGVIQADHRRTNGDLPIQIASVATLQTRKKMPVCGVGMVDEAHLRFKWLDKWFSEATHPIVGLSATPWSKGLGDIYDDLLIPVTIRELIDDGHLSPFKVYAPSHPDLKGVGTTGGNDPDFCEDQLAQVMTDGRLVADVVETWLKLGENRSTLCFAVNRAHAKFLQEKFEAAGISTGYIDCETPKAERAAIREQFADGRLRIVCNVDVLGVGVDWDVRCIILARPTKSLIRHVQTVGRGLRTAEGKDYCLILDHGDSHLRLGFVTDIDITEMHSKRVPERTLALMRKPSVTPVECKRCHALMPPRTKTCPCCGYARMLSAVEVDTMAGQLREFNGERIELKRNNRAWTIEDKAAFFGQLKYYGQSYGKKEGWAAYKYKAKFGVWPNDHRIRYARPQPPTQETMQYIRSQQIRFAKSKKAQERKHLEAAE